jgi:hypothetical protein
LHRDLGDRVGTDGDIIVKSTIVILGDAFAVEIMALRQG